MKSIEFEHPLKNRSSPVELSEEDTITGAKIYDLFRERLIRGLAWNIKNGVVTIPKKASETKDTIIDGLNTEEISEQLARVIAGFKMVEDFLPDYMGKGNKLVRNNMGLFMTNLQWGREELQHSLALGEILEQTGHKTREKTIEDYQRNLGRTLELPYSTARQIVIYGAFQERSTYLGYMALKKRAEEENAPKTAKILGYIAGDEAYHHAGYTELARIYHQTDPEGTVIDSLYIARNFKMPAEEYHPDRWQWKKDFIEVCAFSKKLVAEEVVHHTLSAFRFVPEQEASKTANEFLGKKSLN